jgi:hypothetical protein
MQRMGKTHRASGADSGSDMKTMLFFKACKEVLEKFEHEDAAFYFEQVETHLRDGGSLDQNKAGNILGV